MIKKLEDYRKQQKDNYSNSIDLDINFIDDVSNYLNMLEIRLFTCGLYESDISEIESAIRRLYAIDYDINMQIRNHIENTQIDERYHELIKYQKYLLTVIGDIGIRLIRILRDLKMSVGKYSKKEFIKDHSSILHLVSTNNHSNQKIRKVSDDSFFYLCQFHGERSSSMRVYNNKNKLYCYGCGISMNIYEYLSSIEQISYNDAILLLAEINKIDIGDNKFKTSDNIVKKYINGASLRRYEERIISGRKRASYKRKTLNNYLAMEKFDQELDTIRRIRTNEYISYPSINKERVLRYVGY